MNGLMKLFTCNIILCIVFQQFIISQNVLFRPFKYNEPHSEIDLKEVSDYEIDNVNPWFIVTVNEGVFTYLDLIDKTRFKNLRFGEIFWVTEEKGEYLRIYKDERRDYNKLSKNAIEYGWVRKYDVLLWQRCLMEKNTRQEKKAFIFYTQPQKNHYSQEKIQYFKDPGLSVPTGESPDYHSILYIYKYCEKNNAVLLGESPFILRSKQNDDESIIRTLKGWVNKDLVVEWNSRLAIEPSWNSDAVEERARNKIKASVFGASDKDPVDLCARGFSKGISNENCELVWDSDLWNSERYENQRKPGYWKRFPVIDDLGDGILKVMVFGNKVTGSNVIVEDDDVEVIRSLNELISDLRKINIVFVIDGTSSMSDFYQPVINSVQRIVQDFESEGDLNKEIKLGYVIYRDYLERDRLVETRQLTYNSVSIINQLRRVEATDLYDNDTHEAVYYGLRTALTQVILNPRETNIIIHLGDAGNHYRSDPSQVDQDEIIKLMVDNKCFYFAFQVNHSNTHKAYDDFKAQAMEIIKAIGKKRYSLWSEFFGNELIDFVPTVVLEGKTKWRLVNGPPLLLMTPDDNESLSHILLENEIVKIVSEVNDYTDGLIEMAQRIFEEGRGGNGESINYEAKLSDIHVSGLYDILLSMGIDSELLKRYITGYSLIAEEGYLSLYHSQLNFPVFKQVMLLDAMELNSYFLKIQRLRTAALNQPLMRQSLYEAWIDIVKPYHVNYDNNYIQNMTISQAYFSVFGQMDRPEIMHKTKLIDILNPEAFTDQLFYRYMNQITFKYIELERILNTPSYPYSFKANDVLYYWIDTDLLP